MTATPARGAFAELIEKEHDPWTYDAVLTFHDCDPAALRDLRDDLEHMGWLAQAEELADLIAGEDWATDERSTALATLADRITEAQEVLGRTSGIAFDDALSVLDGLADAAGVVLELTKENR